MIEKWSSALGKTHEASKIYYCNGQEPQESGAALDNFVSRKKNWNCA